MTAPHATVGPIDAVAADSAQPGLTWGLKRSFIRYISSLRDGQHAELEGASLVPPSSFRFSTDSTELDDDGTGTIRFRGQVRLGGHGGMLFVMIADPWVEIGRDAALLTVVDVEHWPDTSRRMPLATLELPDATRTEAGLLWSSVEVRLTREGTEVFNDQYAVGEEMDPLTMLIPG